MTLETRRVTDAELSVLHVLWNEGASTIRRLTDVLYPKGGVAHYYTVQKLLDRLEAKGCVARDRTGRAHSFRATLARGDLLGGRLKELAETICGGSLVPMLTELVRLRRLTPEEHDTLERLVDQLAKKGKRR